MKKTPPSSSLFPTDNSAASRASSPLPGYVNILQGQVGRYIEGVTDARYIGLYTDEITTCHIIIVYGVRDGKTRFSLMHDDSSFSSEDIQKELAFVGEPSQVIVVQNWDKQRLFTSKIPTALRLRKLFLPEMQDAVTVSVGNGEPRIDFFSADDTSKLLYNAPQAMRLHAMYKFNLITDEIDAQLKERKCDYSSEKLLFSGRNFCTYGNVDINSMAAFTRETMAHMQKKSYSSCADVYTEMMQYFRGIVPHLSSQAMHSRYAERVLMLAQMYCYLTNQISLLENDSQQAPFMNLLHRYSTPSPGVYFYNQAVAFYKRVKYTQAVEKVQLSVQHYRSTSQKPELKNALFLLGRSKFNLGELEEAVGHLREAKALEDSTCSVAGKAPAPKYQDRLAECEAALEEAKNSASPSA